MVYVIFRCDSVSRTLKLNVRGNRSVGTSETVHPSKTVTRRQMYFCRERKVKTRCVLVTFVYVVIANAHPHKGSGL